MDSRGEEQYQPPRRRHRALPFLLGLPFATPNLYTDSPAAVGRSLARSAGPRLESALQQILQRIDPVFGATSVNDLYVLAADQLEQDESASQLLDKPALQVVAAGIALRARHDTGPLQRALAVWSGPIQQPASLPSENESEGEVLGAYSPGARARRARTRDGHKDFVPGGDGACAAGQSFAASAAQCMAQRPPLNELPR